MYEWGRFQTTREISRIFMKKTEVWPVKSQNLFHILWKLTQCALHTNATEYVVCVISEWTLKARSWSSSQNAILKTVFETLYDFQLISALFFRICSIIFGRTMWTILNYQKLSLRVLLSICLIFSQFQSGVAYKSVVF